jgi:hypothetical protein
MILFNPMRNKAVMPPAAVYDSAEPFSAAQAVKRIADTRIAKTLQPLQPFETQHSHTAK